MMVLPVTMGVQNGEAVREISCDHIAFKYVPLSLTHEPLFTDASTKEDLDLYHGMLFLKGAFGGDRRRCYKQTRC
jgi:hypothetical protein